MYSTGTGASLNKLKDYESAKGYLAFLGEGAVNTLGLSSERSAVLLEPLIAAIGRIAADNAKQLLARELKEADKLEDPEKTDAKKAANAKYKEVIERTTLLMPVDYQPLFKAMYLPEK